MQSGSTNDLTCASSARVVEWGTSDHVSTPYVSTVKVQLNDSECQGQAVHVIALKADGTEEFRFQSVRLYDNLASGTQYVTLESPGHPNSGIAVEELDAVRITVDGGYPGMVTGGHN